MECTVSWTGNSGTRSGMGFVAETGSGHAVLMDGAPDAAKPENGGQNLAPRPMELVLAGKVKVKPFVELHPLAEITRVFEGTHHREIKRRAVLVP